MRRIIPALLCVIVILLFPSRPYAVERPGIISEQWTEVRLKGDKIGFGYQKAERTDTGYTLTAKSMLKLDIAGSTQDISTSRAYFFDADLSPLRFTYMQKMLNHRQFFEGEIEGDVMHMTIRSEGTVTNKDIPFDANTQLADALNFLLGRKKLSEGETYSYKVFLEPLMATETITVTVGKLIDFEYEGTAEKAWKITSRFKNFETTSYVTPDGRVLMETSPMGLTSVAVSEKRAVTFPDGVMPFTALLAFSLITPDRPIENPDAIATMKVNISGLAKKELIPSDARQTVTGITATARDGNPLYTIALTVTKNDRKKIPRTRRSRLGAEMKPYLEPSFEAQADDPLIRKQMHKIVGDEKDAFAAAMKIYRWVYENIDKKFVDTFSAVGTLKTREGECQSHTNLFAALARAAGIPTRTVSGIVYSREYGGFLYHAWPEVHVGGWIAMDPTLGQEIADATHIKLIEGELSKQLQLFEFIGRIGIDVITLERYS